MRSWLSTHVVPSERPVRRDERDAERSYELRHWHPTRGLSGAMGHVIR